MDHVGVEDDEFYLVEPAMEAQRKLSKEKRKAARASNNFGVEPVQLRRYV